MSIKRALIVDSDQMILSFYESFLEERHAQFDRVFVDNPYEAIKLIESEDFDIISTGFVMKYFPLSGIYLVGEFRKKNPKAPAIVLSGDIFTAKKEAEENGLTEKILFVAKPLSFDDLSRKIEDWLGVSPW